MGKGASDAKNKKLGGHGLAELCAPCFRLVLDLKQPEAFAPYATKEALSNTFKDLLEQVKSKAKARVRPPDPGLIDKTLFALVALIDYAVVTAPAAWEHKVQWRVEPLQLELYNQYDADLAFFKYLDELLRKAPHSADVVEVIEVYYLCILLGFRGRYGEKDEEGIKRHLRDILTDVPALKRDAIDTIKLAPKIPPRRHRVARPDYPWWVRYAVLAGSIVGLWIVLYLIG